MAPRARKAPKAQETAVAKVEMKMAEMAVKLSPPWTSNIVAWFGRAEVLFGLRKIRREMDRFNIVVAHLDERTSVVVSDLLIEPPADAYTQLKARLIANFTLSSLEKRSALSKAELGDQKPSDLLTKIKSLAERKSQYTAAVPFNSI
ncbi:uncharacterized protein LOC143922697 [Arctopsyche grandis]|uniref:uncharacterized protein LOC143922697 n=1 Tax=Arctopsyche grandis TaxID=121162 RepID=UPI00406D80AC